MENKFLLDKVGVTYVVVEEEACRKRDVLLCLISI